MGVFTDKELEYLKGQRLARLATSGAEGSPHVVPVGFRVSDDGSAIDVGGHGFAGSKKYRDIKANAKVAIVVDDRHLRVRLDVTVLLQSGEAVASDIDRRAIVRHSEADRHDVRGAFGT